MANLANPTIFLEHDLFGLSRFFNALARLDPAIYLPNHAEEDVDPRDKPGGGIIFEASI